ncbi:MAG: hypothetical protein WC551_10255 [Patescibacteria group bacterium]
MTITISCSHCGATVTHECSRADFTPREVSVLEKWSMFTVSVNNRMEPLLDVFLCNQCKGGGLIPVLTFKTKKEKKA